MKQLLVLIFGLILGSVSWAHGDEDHGGQPHSESPHSESVSVQAGLIQTSAQSPDFELLASIEGETLTVYLNRFADNSPVANAEIEIESGAFKARLKPVSGAGDGVYRVSAAALAQAGEHALAFTIIAGEQSDLLDATLKVAAPPAISAITASRSSNTLIAVGAGLGTVAALIVLVVILRRRKGKHHA
ncbi:hypothetical protein [Chitinibacter sp. S2-10]|uniref:hypothetical protein n=1 Tax=Chitinibacter sp. S2-10 TaxID=3373597 RepID=UPI003977C4B5